MEFRRAALLACLLASSWIAAPAMAEDKKWAIGTPRQNWAHADGVVNLQPGTAMAPQSLADRMMIADAFARWGIGYDEGRLEVIRALFPADGVLEVLEAGAKPLQSLKGIDTILKNVASDRAKQNDQRRHAISNVVIDRLDGSKATAIAYGVVTAAGGGELYLGATVIYRGDMTKMPDGTWRFAKLVIGMDAYRRPAPAASK